VKKRGFTMVELMIVIAIISVLATIIIPKMSGARDSSKLEACKLNLRHIATAVSMYMNDNGEAPTLGIINSGHILISQGYLKAIPVCPGKPGGGNSYYIGDASGTYPGDYAINCLNASSLCHPAYIPWRPLYYLGHGYRYN